MTKVPAVLRVLGVADVASGLLALAVAPWLGDQLGVDATAVRLAAALLVVLGVETVVLAGRRAMATATVVAEAACAFLMLDVVVLADTTRTGAVIALGLAAWCAAVALRVAMLQRSRPEVLAAA